mmetsp:Transcript_15193/g.23628  ORF Transcript_15193/g.23628 Transcript_15193/m.23628 type:complete len:105 (-) Transcript_15193:2084-2398(-)
MNIPMHRWILPSMVQLDCLSMLPLMENSHKNNTHPITIVKDPLFLRTWWKKGKTRVMASLASELQVSKFNVASSAQELLEDSMILGADEAGKESNGSYASALMT